MKLLLSSLGTAGLAWIALCVVIGIAGGVGGYTFIYADGASYLGNNPESCANCHVMQDHLDAWTNSVHKNVATCNDCHVPHGNFVEKYASKGMAGFRHSWAFTTDHFHEPIQISKSGMRTVESSCRHCHESVVHAIDTSATGTGEPMSCVHCHAGVGHP